MIAMRIADPETVDSPLEDRELPERDASRHACSCSPHAISELETDDHAVQIKPPLRWRRIREQRAEQVVSLFLWNLADVASGLGFAA